MIIRGTCGACTHYRDGLCNREGSAYSGRYVWEAACVPCDGYERGTRPLTPISPEALASAWKRPSVFERAVFERAA